MKVETIVKNSQEQAVAAWINYLNQTRLNRLVEALSAQRENFTSAMETIEKAFATIKDDIIARNRGGGKGIHGFVAEIAESGIGNARRQILGKAAEYVWINDNGPIDFRRGAEVIQQKFVQSGGYLSLKAVSEHLRQYPKYLIEGGKYQIPKDHYEKIIAYLKMPEDVANKLPTSTREFSLRQWKWVHAFFSENHIDVNKLEPSILEYHEVQSRVIDKTIEKEKKHLKKVNRTQRDAAYQKSKPSFAEGAKATAVGAAFEGAAAFVLGIIRKRKAGKKIKDFDEADWIDLAGDSGKGAIKGGIRGASIYLLTNYTGTPAAVASAVTTAAFGVAEQANLYRNGAIDEIAFIENSEILCLDASISALASFAGQALIPIPILGAIIGNAIGTMLYQIGKDSLSKKEQELIEKYLQEIADLDKKLLAEYQYYIELLKHNFAVFLELLTSAFDPEIEKAFEGSVVLAKYMGVPTEEILDSHEKIASYFLG